MQSTPPAHRQTHYNASHLTRATSHGDVKLADEHLQMEEQPFTKQLSV